MRLGDESAARAEQDAAADDATVAELKNDLLVTLRKLHSTKSELESLRVLHFNREGWEQYQTETTVSAQAELHGIPTEARQEAQSTYELGLAEVWKEKEEEKRRREKAESLLQHYLDRMKVAEDSQAHAENSLRQIRVENASIRDRLSACERDAVAKDKQITTLKTDLASITRLHAESETCIVTLRAERAALQDSLVEMRAKAYGERHSQGTTASQVMRLSRARSDESQTRRSAQRRFSSLRSRDAGTARKLRLPLAQVRASFGVDRALNMFTSDHTQKPRANPVIGMKRAATSIPEPMKDPRSKRPRIVEDDHHRASISDKIMEIKTSVPLLADRIESLSALILEGMVSTKKLPSPARAYTGYVPVKLLSNFYDLVVPDTLPMVCLDSCEMRSGYRFAVQPDSSYPNSLSRPLFAKLDHQPGLPVIPGQPGIILTTHPPEVASKDVPDRIHPLLVGLPGGIASEFLYVGNYAHESTSELMSAREWMGLPQKVRDKLVNSLSTEPGKLNDNGCDEPSCLHMLARIALRKHNLPLEHAPALAQELHAYHGRDTVDLGISRDDVKMALDAGEEKLSIVKLIPKSFSAEWYLELQGLASGALAKKRPNDAPRLRRASKPPPPTPREVGFEELYRRAVSQYKAETSEGI